MTIGHVYEERNGLCVYIALHPSFEAAMSVAREREGLPAGADGD